MQKYNAVRRSRGLCALVALGLAGSLVACSSSDKPADQAPASSAAGAEQAPAEEPEAPLAEPPADLPAECEQFAQYMGYEGTTVSFGTNVIEPESDHIRESVAQFEACTGITIDYQGSKDFNSQLVIRAQGGNPPDLALQASPGAIANLVATGTVKLPPAGTVENAKNFSADWQGYGTVDGVFYGAPFSAEAKSLVWYSPKAFAAAGYTVPATWDELMALSDTIAKAGNGKPWCGGMEDGTGTGWIGGDWVEEVVLRQAGPEAYDRWISHDLLWDSPEILGAMEVVEGWMQNPEWVNGGHGDVATLVTVSLADAGLPIVTGECWMLQFPTFYANMWPADSSITEDGDIFAFVLPTMKAGEPAPIEGSGDFVIAFSDRGEVQAVQTYLSSPEWATARIRVTGQGFVSPNSKVDPAAYGNEVDRLTATLVASPDVVFRFDAVDQMPAAVSSGPALTEVVSWFAQGKPKEDVAKAIDAAFP